MSNSKLEYKCEKCEQTFDTKYKYECHLNRKTSCVICYIKISDDKYACKFCNKEYTRSNSVKSHIDTCFEKLKHDNDKQIEELKSSHIIELELQKTSYETEITNIKSTLNTEISELKFDFFFLNRGEIVPEFFLQELRKKQLNCKFILNTWDSFANLNHNYKSKL